MKNEQMSREITSWLNPSDPSNNVNRARELRYARTGSWFIGSPAFNEWKSASRRHLWLHGIPGCGKTVLTATLFEHLNSMQDCIVLTYFFDFNDAAKQDLDGVVRSLFFQLYKSSLDSSNELTSLYESYRRVGIQPGTQTLQDSLFTAMAENKRILILIDAIDECTTKTALINCIEQLVFHPGLHQVQLIVTGRNEEPFLGRLPSCIGKENCIALDTDCVNADIQLYVEARLSGPMLKKWAAFPDLQRRIQIDIGHRADGM